MGTYTSSRLNDEVEEEGGLNMEKEESCWGHYVNLVVLWLRGKKARGGSWPYFNSVPIAKKGERGI